MTVHVPDDRATTLRLADVLGSAGFHQAGLQALLEDAMRSVDSDDVAELLRRTKSADQLPVLARLFLTDVGAPVAAAASALRPLPLADLVAAGSHSKAKEAGKVRIEGKEYTMQDGDVVDFRFNV